MANGTRPFPLLIVLVIGAAVGCHLKPESERFAPVPGNHLMKVGPAAANVGAAIQKNHKMFWKARDSGKTLQIVFKKEDFPTDPDGKRQPPFEGMPDIDQRFECKQNEVCKSGAVNPKVIPLIPANGLYYKYWQVLIDDATGTRDEADAGIIIER